MSIPIIILLPPALPAFRFMSLEKCVLRVCISYRMGSTLGLLLALTGGPIEPNQADVAQTETIQLYRTSGGTKTLIYESSFDQAIAEPGNSPVLQEGDIISVEVKQKRRLNWRDVFTVIGPILSTLLLIERLTNS